MLHFPHFVMSLWLLLKQTHAKLLPLTSPCLSLRVDLCLLPTMNGGQGKKSNGVFQTCCTTIHVIKEDRRPKAEDTTCFHASTTERTLNGCSIHSGFSWQGMPRKICEYLSEEVHYLWKLCWTQADEDGQYRESRIVDYGWNPLFKLHWTYHDLEVWMFYANAWVENETEFSFVTKIYGVPIITNPDILAVDLGIP